MNPEGQLLSVQHCAQYLPCGGPPQQCFNPPHVSAPEHAKPCEGSIIKALVDEDEKMAAIETIIRIVFILIRDLEI